MLGSELLIQTDVMSNFTNQKPDNYLVWAILTTVMCCVPFGIVSIVNSTKVDTLWAVGDHAGAIKASENAKKWAIITAITGAVVAVVNFIVFFFIGLAEGLGY